MNFKEYLLRSAEEEVERKRKEERLKIENQIERDLETIVKLADLVDKKVLYKEERDRLKIKYTMITPEILFKDYQMPPPQYTRGGIRIHDKDSNRSAYATINGIDYYHMGFLIENYKKDIESAIERTQRERDELVRKRDLLDDLERRQPAIIEMVKQYNESQKEDE